MTTIKQSCKNLYFTRDACKELMRFFYNEIFIKYATVWYVTTKALGQLNLLKEIYFELQIKSYSQRSVTRGYWCVKKIYVSKP